ncbi:7179_t:CDS:1, partial [Racocetra persica]
IVEPDRHNKNKSSTNSTYIAKSSNPKDNDTLLANNMPDIVVSKLLSFGDKIALMTKVLYEKQRKKNQILELDSDNFRNMLKNAEPLLKRFFNKLYNVFIPDR